MTDTSDEAVERLAAQYSKCGLPNDDLVAATLRALLAERAALQSRTTSTSDAAWDGRPENPEHTKRHWLTAQELTPCLFWWWPDRQTWSPAEIDWEAEEYKPSDMALGWVYLGPCLTPAEVTALRQERDRLRDDADEEQYARYEMLARAQRAEAERDAARAKALEEAAFAAGLSAWTHIGDDAYSKGMDAGARDQVEKAVAAIRALAQEPQA